MGFTARLYLYLSLYCTQRELYCTQDAAVVQRRERKLSTWVVLNSCKDYQKKQYKDKNNKKKAQISIYCY